MSRDRATSLDRCQFPSRSARRIETLCSPERSRIACRKVSWSIPANLNLSARLARRSLFFVELGALKGCPGILRLDYLREERMNSEPTAVVVRSNSVTRDPLLRGRRISTAL